MQNTMRFVCLILPIRFGHIVTSDKALAEQDPRQRARPRRARKIRKHSSCRIEASPPLGEVPNRKQLEKFIWA
jgi:hypothetical protein